MTPALAFDLRHAQRMALAVALVGLLGCAVGAVVAGSEFLRAYLAALLFWSELPVGCLVLLLAYHVMGGIWGETLGAAIESAARTLPLIALLFLPVALGLHPLYAWDQPAVVAAEPTVAAKAAYLNPAFFIVRMVVYLAVWIALAFLITDPTHRLADRPRRRGLGAAGLILYGLTASFASIDWILSLEPTFNSSNFGLLFMTDQIISGAAFAITATLLASEVAARPLLLRERRLMGLGNLLLGAVVTWAYLAFMDYIVIWSGDLPHKAEWYIARGADGWGALAWIIGFLHLALPFAMLLSRHVRTDWRWVLAVTGLLLAGRALHVIWLTLPAFRPAPPASWLVLAAFLGIGGVWVSAFLWCWSRRSSAAGGSHVRHG